MNQLPATEWIHENYTGQVLFSRIHHALAELEDDEAIPATFALGDADLPDYVSARHLRPVSPVLPPVSELGDDLWWMERHQTDLSPLPEVEMRPLEDTGK